MRHALLDRSAIDESPATYLRRIGDVFVCFGESTQDSGNVSFGVQVGRERYFVKTAGLVDETRAYLRHPARVALLRTAVRLYQSVVHSALVRLRRLIESPDGPLLVFDWIEGELLGGPAAQRSEPSSAWQRFRALPVQEICACLDTLFDLHDQIARAGWICGDFYDGSLMYDFVKRQLTVIDVDSYADAPFPNSMGRMFGSTRFMAPEEFALGAMIDQRTNVFTMGRTALLLLGDGALDRGAFRGTDALFDVVERACQQAPADRFEDMARFFSAWTKARAWDDGDGA